MKYLNAQKKSLLLFLTFVFQCHAGVIWRGTGIISSSNGVFGAFQLDDLVEWEIHYQENLTTDQADENGTYISIQFTIDKQIFRLDSANKKISGFNFSPGAGDMINWSISESDELNVVEIPADNGDFFMTFRVKAKDMLHDFTFENLRNPSLIDIEDFFGTIFTESGSLWFDVDANSVQIFEKLHAGTLNISVAESNDARLSWNVSNFGIHRIEASYDLKSFETLHEELLVETTGFYYDRLDSPSRFYRLVHLNEIYSNQANTE